MSSDRRHWLPFLMVGLCLAGPLRAQEDHPPSDGGSYAVFEQLNALEIALARVAAERGDAEQVRGLGQRIAAEQEAMQHQGRELGRRLHIFGDPPADPLGSYAATVSRLLATPRAEFDAAYLKQELVFQRNVSGMLADMLPSVRDPALTDFLKEAGRSFERHRNAVEAVARQLTPE